MAAETRESGDAARRILTDDGRIVTGYGRREPRDSIEVCAIVAQAPVTLPTIAIQETLEAGRPMPEGMTHAEVRDLIRYLVELKPR